jgi:hypothetical protein
MSEGRDRAGSGILQSIDWGKAHEQRGGPGDQTEPEREGSPVGHWSVELSRGKPGPSSRMSRDARPG